jgi:hypothetical protein
MCLPVTSQNRRARVFLCVGMLCLALSLGMQSFHLTFGLGAGLFDFVRGLLAGIAIVMNLYAAWLGGRWRSSRQA